MKVESRTVEQIFAYQVQFDEQRGMKLRKTHSSLKTDPGYTGNVSREIMEQDEVNRASLQQEDVVKARLKGKCGNAKGKGYSALNHLAQDKRFYFKP